MSGKLSKTVLTLFIMLAFVPIWTYSDLSLSSSTKSLTTLTGTMYAETARMTIGTIDQLINSRSLDVQMWSQDPMLSRVSSNQVSPSELQPLLDRWGKELGAFSAVHIIDPSGNLVVSSRPSLIGQSAENEVWYKAANDYSLYDAAFADEGNTVFKPFIGELGYDSLNTGDKRDSGYGLTIASPISYAPKDSNTKNRPWLLVARLSWNEIFNICASVKLRGEPQGDGSYIAIIDKTGSVIARPALAVQDKDPKDKDHVHRPLLNLNLVEANFNSAILATHGQGGYRVEREASTGNLLLMAYAASDGYGNFSGFGWSAIVVEDLNKTLATVNSSRKLRDIITIASLLMAFVVALTFTRSVRFRVKDITRFLQSLSKGYFTERLKIEGSDEISDFSNSLNSVAAKVESKISEANMERDRAIGASRAQGAFLSEISSELRSPLNSIVETSEILLGTDLSQEQTAFVRSVRTSACSMISLTNDLKDISKIESGQSNLRHSSFDLQSLIYEVADVLAGTSEHLGVELAVYYGFDTHRMVVGDPVKLHQVFTNLAAHVLRFVTSEQLLISVHIKELDDRSLIARIVLDDSGIGLDKEKLNHLFAQGAEGADAPIEELNSELSTSRRLLKLMGGDLGSVRGHDFGSVFWISLPLEKSLVEPPAGASIKLSLPAKHALVAAKSDLARSLIGHYLHDRRSLVEFASSTSDCLSILEDNEHSKTLDLAIISSEVLTSTDDDGLCQKVLDWFSDRSVPLIVLAGIGKDVSNDLKRLPHFSQFNKPIRSSELFDALYKALAAKRGADRK